MMADQLLPKQNNHTHAPYPSIYPPTCACATAMASGPMLGESVRM